MIALIATLSIFLSSFVSAAPLSITAVSIPKNVDHDIGSFPITFELTNEGLADNAVSFSDSVITSGTATIVMPNAAISDGSTDPVKIQLTAIVNFPAHQSGIIEGKLVAKPSSTGDPKELPFSVNIQQSTELEIKETQVLTQAQDGIVTVENTGNQVITGLNFEQSGDFNIAFTPTTINVLNAGNSQEVNVTGINLDALKFGTNTVTISAKADGEVASNELSFQINKGFCKFGEVGGNLEIREVDVQNLGDGSDDEWKILDIIEVDVKVKHLGKIDEKIRDIFVELALFDDKGVDVTSDLEFENTGEEEIDLGNLGDRDDDTVTFRFKVTADLDGSNYKLAVKAYSDDSDFGEDVECTDTSNDLSNKFFETIQLERESDDEDFLEIDEIRINPEDVTCGDTVDISFDIVNVGDQKVEDRFKVNLDSSQLGLSLSQEIKKDLDEGDTERVLFTFRVPEGLEDEAYPLRITTEHDYRDSSDSYDVQSSEEKSVLLTVFGCSLSDVMPLGNKKIASISASLDSDAKAGQEMLITAVLTNLDSESQTFIISASNYESWAEINAISKRLVTLNSGESEELSLSFNVNKDTSGQQSFVIEARAGENLETREVVVNIEGISTTSGSTPKIDLGGNNLLWLIGIINVILIILIIVVAVRISRR